MNKLQEIQNEKLKQPTDVSETQSQIVETKADIISDLEKNDFPIAINEWKLMLWNLDLIDFIKNNYDVSEELKNQELIPEISETAKVSRITMARNWSPAKLSISKSLLNSKWSLVDIYIQLLSFYQKDKINNIKLKNKDRDNLSTISEDEQFMQINRNKMQLTLELNKTLISKWKKSALDWLNGRELLNFVNKDIWTDMFGEPEEWREKYIFTMDDLVKYGIKNE